MSILDVRNIRKTYNTRFGDNSVEAIRGLSFSMEKGEYIALMGESGSGKTTLLNIIASLDRADSGEVFLKGTSLKEIPDGALAAFRRENLGFVFQDFNLLDNFSIKDNILLPLVLAGEPYESMHGKILRIASRLGIDKLLSKFPYEVSGGEKQRTAVARALITAPALLLADEPTGALDSYAADSLLHLFADVNKNGQTILMVTHSVNAASRAGRVLFLRDGRIFHQMYRGHHSNETMFAKISDTLTMIASGRQAV